MIWKQHQFWLGVVMLATTVLGQALQLQYEWKDMEYQFPTQAIRDAAISTKKYIPGNSVPIHADVYYGSSNVRKVFVTIPRFAIGVPVTLGTVSSSFGPKGQLVIPYPDYSWHSSHGTDCNGLTSVFRTVVDQCNRIWVLDTGRIGSVQHCPPQLVVFNLIDNSMIFRYKFPAGQFIPTLSLFITPVVDIRDPPPGQCQRVMVYIADVSGFGIIVYDHVAKKSWRVENKLMFPNPYYGTYTIAGETFDLMDGVLGMAVSPVYEPYANRKLFFHPLASITENAVPLRLIDNSTWAQNPNPRAFYELGARGVMQSAAEAMDRNGNLFFGLLANNAIACWDSTLPYNEAYMRILVRDDLRLQFASGVKIVTNPMGKEELWVLTSRIQKSMLGTYNFNEVNFRILMSPVDTLLGRTRC